MRPRKRDRLISIEQAIDTQAPGSGAVTTAWVSKEQVWAEVRLPTGAESLMAQQLNATIDGVFNIRYRTDVAAKGWSVVFEGRRYKVTIAKEPDDVPRRSELDIYASAQADVAA